MRPSAEQNGAKHRHRVLLRMRWHDAGTDTKAEDRKSNDRLMPAPSLAEGMDILGWQFPSGETEWLAVALLRCPARDLNSVKGMNGRRPLQDGDTWKTCVDPRAAEVAARDCLRPCGEQDSRGFRDGSPGLSAFPVASRRDPLGKKDHDYPAVAWRDRAASPTAFRLTIAAMPMMTPAVIPTEFKRIAESVAFFMMP